MVEVTKTKGLSMLLGTALMGIGMIVSAALNQAQAYELTTVFKTEHYAVNQVILGHNETLDGPTESSITGDVQTQNRLDKLYQSTTVVFPTGSPGYTGKINTPVVGILSISNYGSGKDRISFNRNAQTASEGGLYISYEQLREMINQRVLNSLIGEFKRLPVVFTDVPITATGFDPTSNGRSFYITSVSDAAIIDLRIDDSVYYSMEEIHKLHKNCKVNVLTFADRMVPNIPLFISGRAAINAINCSAAPANTTPALAPTSNVAPAAAPAATAAPAAKATVAPVTEPTVTTAVANTNISTDTNTIVVPNFSYETNKGTGTGLVNIQTNEPAPISY